MTMSDFPLCSSCIDNEIWGILLRVGSSNICTIYYLFECHGEKTVFVRRNVWKQRGQRGENKWKPTGDAVWYSLHFEASAYERDPDKQRNLVTKSNLLNS